MRRFVRHGPDCLGGSVMSEALTSADIMMMIIMMIMMMMMMIMMMTRAGVSGRVGDVRSSNKR